MSFSTIDPRLNEWVARRGLHLYTSYKDEPVRSLEIVNSAGKKAQLWIDPEDPSGRVHVHVWDYSHRRRDLEGELLDIDKLLEEAFRLAEEWLGMN